MISPDTLKRWESIAEELGFNTFNQFIATAIEYYIANL